MNENPMNKSEHQNNAGPGPKSPPSEVAKPKRFEVFFQEFKDIKKYGGGTKFGFMAFEGARILKDAMMDLHLLIVDGKSAPRIFLTIEPATTEPAPPALDAQKVHLRWRGGTKAILDAVGAWWRGHRPVGWTEEDHIANPIINMTGDVLGTEKQLARLYVMHLKVLKRAAKRKD